jgi:zinc transport system substrate-binding protein
VAAAAAGQPLQVVVSILPQQFLVERVAGERVQVLTLVQPGDNEATYSPGPATLAALDGARAWFTMGVHFELAWLERITRDRPAWKSCRCTRACRCAGRRRASRRRSATTTTTTMPACRTRIPGRTRAWPRGWRSASPRPWRASTRRVPLSTPSAAPAAGRAARAARGARRAAGAGARRHFAVFHPSWGYFADAYGLTQLPIELGGREPGPRGLAEVIRRGREAGVRVVFVQQQFSQRSALAVAEALGAKVVEADPLALDYIDNLRVVAIAWPTALAPAPGDAMTASLAFHGVSFGYGDGPDVVENVDLEIGEHELIGLIGPNGGGKSTLLKLAAGLLKPRQGTVRVFGRAPHEARDEIGYVPQFALFPRDFPITVAQAVLLGRLGGALGLRWSAADRAAARRAIEETELDALADRPLSACRAASCNGC